MQLVYNFYPDDEVTMWIFKKQKKSEGSIGVGFNFVTPAIQKYIKKTSYTGTQKTYNLYHNGRPDFDVEMQMYLDTGFKKVKIIANQCCLECNVFDGKVVTITEVQKDKFLPVKNCTNQLDPSKPEIHCTCCYVADFS